MDKNAIQRFTEWAKIELTKAVKQKAFEYGIFEKSIIDSNSIIGEKVLTSAEQKQRKELVKQINENGYDAVIEEITYTWFNRFIALRFMEVNGYLPTRVRVFSDDENNFNPQILKEALTIELDNIDKTVIIDYLTKNDNEALYKYLLIAQCNSLNKIIPTLFEKIANYTELLFPDNLLKKNSILEHLVTDIKEEDWKEQVQILGWIYQFYVACNREEYRKAKVIKKEHIPTLSQIFTPDWIVRYMTENSLGRIWVESYPNSPLKDNMKYYVDDAEQEEEVQKKLDEIKYKNVNPEDIKVIEPCCGSGHILVYIFDLLYKMYEEKGYKKADIPTLIFKNNIWGLDIDKRASQLANFSLLMKARSMDNRFFSREKVAKPKIYEIIDSQNIKKTNYMEIMNEAGFTKETIAIAKYLVDTYENAKVIGSLLKVNIKDYSNFVKELREKKKEGPKDLFHTEFYEHTIAKLIKLAKLASTMIRKYDVMVTNPPYLGSSSLEPICKEYAIKHYPNSKADMFAMFMEVDFVKTNGFRAIINMQGWMFLSTYKELRSNYINNNQFISMIHLGTHAFDSIGGDVVNTTTFVIRHSKINNSNGVYLKLNKCESKEEKFLSGDYEKIIFNQQNFSDFPGYQIAYWVTEDVRKCFKLNKISDYFFSDGRNITGNNNKFLRFHWEVDHNKIGKNKKWLNYVKGGSYRKWYGNIIDVVDWSEEARRFYHKNSSSRIIDPYLWYRTGVTWNLIASGNGCFRLMKGENTFDMGGPSVFPKYESIDLIYTIAYLNSNVVSLLNSVVNQTINYQVEHILSTPIIYSDLIENKIDELANECIEIAKQDWDSFEYSNDYLRAPLLVFKTKTINEAFAIWSAKCEERFNTLKANEEELNRIFIEIYGLQDELTPEVEDKDVTVRLAELQRDIKSLISYIIGLNFGRYSLDVEGLAYAGGEFNWDKYKTIIPDKDNIIPICDDEYFADDLCGKVINSIRIIYGEETLEENLKFIADALGGKGTSREILRNYLLNDFYKDHLKIYQKRPIYWLFESGKRNGFKALIYMHRYTPDLLARMRTDYVHEQQERYRTQIENLEKEVLHLEGVERVKTIKKLEKIKMQDEEILAYEEKIHHLADQMIDIDLDDGVKVNYEKFGEVLAPIK